MIKFNGTLGRRSWRWRTIRATFFCIWSIKILLFGVFISIDPRDQVRLLVVVTMRLSWQL